MESETKEGLTVIYNEEESLITFEWDENTHPEYNSLAQLTQGKLHKMLIDYCNDCLNHFSEKTSQAGED